MSTESALGASEGVSRYTAVITFDFRGRTEGPIEAAKKWSSVPALQVVHRLRPQPGEQSEAAARRSAEPQRISAFQALNEQNPQKRRKIIKGHTSSIWILHDIT